MVGIINNSKNNFMIKEFISQEEEEKIEDIPESDEEGEESSEEETPEI